MSEAKEPSKYAKEIVDVIWTESFVRLEEDEAKDKLAFLLKCAIDAALANQSHAPASRLWVSRREHEQEVARLKAQIAELEAQLAGSSSSKK